MLRGSLSHGHIWALRWRAAEAMTSSRSARGCWRIQSARVSGSEGTLDADSPTRSTTPRTTCSYARRSGQAPVV